MAREKRTGPPKPDTSDLPTLTAKQLRFVEGIVAGLTGSEAYRQAYDTSTMTNASISAEATKLRHRPDIDRWIRAFHIARLGSGVLTKEQHIQELGAIRERAVEQGDLKSAVAAEHLRGKASGFYVERSEVTIYNPAEILAQIANIDPTIASRLADRFNLKSPGPIASDVVDLAALPPLDPSSR